MKHEQMKELLSTKSYSILKRFIPHSEKLMHEQCIIRIMLFIAITTRRMVDIRTENNSTTMRPY